MSGVGGSETVGWLGSWLRLVWRHWPVLFALAAAAVIARTWLINEVLIDAARWWDGLGGELLFAVVPTIMLVTMILMLRVVRPSLPYLGPRERPEPVLRHLASVAVPFVAFYFAAGYLKRDWEFFGQAIALTAFQETLASSPFGDGEPIGSLPQILNPDRPIVYAAIAAGAFLVRWILVLAGSARRTWLGLVAVYPEVMWVTVGATATGLYLAIGRHWFERTRVYEEFTSNLDGWDLPGLTTLLPSVETAGAVVAIPVAALVTGTTVLVAAARPRPPQQPGVRRFLPARPESPVGGQFGVLWESVSRVFRAGVPATMLFCLAFAVVRVMPGFLTEVERLLIGPRDPATIWLLIEFPLIWLNEAITLVFMVSLIAAFVDRTARREARLTGEPPSATAPVDIDGAATQRLPVTASYPPAPSSYPPSPYPYAPGQSPYPPSPSPYTPGPSPYPPAPSSYPPSPHGPSPGPQGGAMGYGPPSYGGPPYAPPSGTDPYGRPPQEQG